jgi:hypothetical protein
VPTLAQAEQALLMPTRAGYLLGVLGVDVMNLGVSPNPFLADPIAQALLACSVPLASVVAPADADLAALAAADWPKFLDLADLRLLAGAAQLLAAKASKEQWPDQTVERANEALLKAYTAKLQLVKQVYGFGVPVLSAGSAVVTAPPPPPWGSGSGYYGY